MTDPNTSSTPAAAPAPAPDKASVWEDFIDIFYAPTAVYARRQTASFWVPLLVVTVLVGGITLAGLGVMQPIIDAETSRAMAAMAKANPQMSPEAIEQGKKFGAMAGKFGAFLGMPILIFVSGLAIWLIGKLFDSVATAGQATLVAAYATVPRVVAAILASAQSMLMDATKLDGMNRILIGPSRFLDPATASPVMLAVLSRFELFTLWGVVLLGIGLAVVGKIPIAKAFVAAALVWVLGSLLPLLAALRAS